MVIAIDSSPMLCKCVSRTVGLSVDFWVEVCSTTGLLVDIISILRAQNLESY